MKKNFCFLRSFLLSATGLATFFAVPSASAQSFDYGALQKLFREPVTTSATGSPQRVSDVPVSMTIITADEIRRSGAHDIPDLLRHVPGVNVLRWTNDQADVSIRGYNQDYSSRLLVLVDGRQVYADNWGYTPWSTIPVELPDIRQIEIVMGPNSALYGFNAVGGVINIVTYDPLYDHIDKVTIAGGTQNRVQGSAIVTVPLSDWGGLRLSIGGWHGDDFSTPQKPQDIGTRRGDERKAANFMAHVRLAPNTDMSLEISHSEVGQPEISEYLAYYAKYRTSSVGVRFSTDTALGAISAHAYFNWSNVVLTGATPIQATYRVTNPLTVVQVQDIIKPAADHTVRISAEYRHSDMNTSPLRDGHLFYDAFAGAVMWNWAVTPDIALTNAVRVDHLSLGRNGTFPAGITLTNGDWNRVSRTEVSFNSGLVWQVSDHDTLRATAARGVQLPSLVNLGGLLASVPPYYIGGVPTLKPTFVMNYGLDWDHEIPAWDASLRVRAYHQTTDGVTANFGGTLPQKGLVVTPANIGNSQANGLELILSGHSPKGWRWSLSYSPELINDNFGSTYPLAKTLVDFQDIQPIHTVTAHLGWSDNRWELDGYLRYESRYDSIAISSPAVGNGYLVRIPGHATFDARVAYRLTKVITLALSGQNLFDSPQRQTSAAEVERRLLFSAAASL